ncbi:MAG TPA: colanic acid biosynthesis glycosyltransferase WcaL [Gammaproteobacteria bacterium]|nr:colanic acid biosynthesis glycosyltransferase WcaL [Gammaproteobacteria bacterium]
MRIAYFLNEFPSLSQTFVFNQITGMIDKGHDIDIYARRRFETEERHVQIENYGLMNRTRYLFDIPDGYLKRLMLAIELVLKRGVWRKPRLLFNALVSFENARDLLKMRSIYSVLAVADRGRYDIIHCQFGTLGPLALKLRNIGAIEGEIVTSFRGYDITRQSGNHAALYKELFQRGALFLPVSKSLRKELEAAGCPPGKVKVLHSGIDCRLFGFSGHRKCHDGTIRLLTIGRFVEKKGIEFTLAAVANVLKSGLKIHYTLVGDGKLKSRIERQIVENHLEETVTLSGWCDHDEVVRLMDESHLLMAPSVTAEDGDEEGIPNVVKEAMAKGLPVLSTWHGGIPELVEDGVSGYLVPERDVTALTDRLSSFCNHPEKWTEMGNRAREKIDAEFDMMRINDELERVYSDIMQEGV